ncbi:MAG: hypothetical protein ABSG41_23160 [Bryobacteraceae bacterium]|jgi:hypothetical protein
MPELTPEEREKIYLEEKARLEFRRELEPKKIGVGKFIGYVALGGLALLVLMFIIGSVIMRRPETASITSTQTPVMQNTGNPAHDRLAALGTSAQASLLGQIAGEGCSGDSAFYMGMDKETRAYWSVRCTNGRSYQVQIQPNATGSTSVMDCDVLKTVANVSCFTRFNQ